MSKRNHLTFLFALISTVMASQIAAQAATNVYLLKAVDGDVILEQFSLHEGELRLFSDPDIITFVLPFGVGQSGDVVQASEGQNTFSVKNTGEEIKVTIVKPDGTQRAMPPVKITDLIKYDMRINVNAANGLKKAFRIKRNAQFSVDNGPIIDMFRGKVPMQPGDYSITTETSLAADLERVYGKVPLSFIEDLMVVEGKVTGGKKGLFIVDFGAGGTLISKSYLPEGIPVEKLMGIEYSEEGTREIDGTMGGAGGDVTTFLGNAVLPGLRFGDMTFPNATVHVIDADLKFGSQNYAGILGMDLLRSAEQVSFTCYPADNFLIFNWKPATRSGMEIPFSIVSDHIFIESSVNGIQVPLIFDTGARGTIISSEISKRAELLLDDKPGKEFCGMDGNIIPSKTATVNRLVLGGKSFTDVPVFVADLAVLMTMGLGQDGGLLGNDFLQRYSQIEVDFTHKIIRLVK